MSRVLGRLAALRAALAGIGWSWRALRELRRDLKRVGLDAVVAPCPAPVLSRAGRRGVAGVLRLGRATCLERSLIVQRVLASAGRPRDVAIGVRSSGTSFSAHAWVVGEEALDGDGSYTVLTRRSPG